MAAFDARTVGHYEIQIGYTHLGTDFDLQVQGFGQSSIDLVNNLGLEMPAIVIGGGKRQILGTVGYDLLGTGRAGEQRQAVDFELPGIGGVIESIFNSHRQADGQR